MKIHRFISTTFAVFAIAGVAKPASDSLLFYNGFDNGFTRFHLQGCCSYSHKIVDDPVGKGDKVARLEWRRGDPKAHGGNRAELKVEGVDEQIGKDYWYGFRLYYPQDTKLPSGLEVVHQWHGSCCHPPLSLQLRDDGNFYVVQQNGKRIKHRVSAWNKGRWIDWVFHVKWSKSTDGYLEVWKDGVKVLNLKNVKTLEPDHKAPYEKMGTYHPGVNRVVYYDEVRVAGPSSTYEDVAPR